MTEFAQQWETLSAKSGPEAELFRLQLLKNLHSDSHTQLSNALVRSDTKAADAASRLEKAAFSLAKRALEIVPSGMSLEAALAAPGQFAAAPAPSWPEQMPSVFPIDKLIRFDRGFEIRLTQSAVNAGWELGFLEAEVRLSDAQAFDSAIRGALGPGVALWVEPNESKKSATGMWSGLWTLAVPPGTKPPNPRGLARWRKAWPR